MTTEATILQELKHLRSDVARLRQELTGKKKAGEQWVTGSIVKKMTGWSNRDLENFRLQGLIKFERQKKGVVRYLVSSVEELKNKLA